MRRLAAPSAAFAAAMLLLAGVGRADEGPPAPSRQAPQAPQADDAEQPVVVPVPVPEPRAPVAPVPAPEPYFPHRPEPLPPPMPPSYYQQQPPEERTLRGRTHNLILPTGETLGDGEAELSAHDFLYYTGAVGLSDQLELDFAMPLVPMFVQGGLRFGLTPRGSRFKLVAGGGAIVSLMDDSKGDAVLSASLTAAYQTDRFNVHATGMFFYVPGSEKAAGLTSVGMTWRVTGKLAVFVEVSELRFGDRRSSAASYSESGGIKLLGDAVDVDLGVMAVSLPDATIDGPSENPSVPIPVVSATKHF